jgi:carnitine-CoA ligase
LENKPWGSETQTTVLEVLSQAVAAYPDDIYLDFEGETYTYGEVDRLSNRLAHGLADLGVARGGTVVCLLDNGIHAVTAFYAVNKLGAINVPVNTAYKGEFLRHQVDDTQATVVICESDYAQRFDIIQNDLARVATIVHRGAAPGGITKCALRTLDSLYVENDAPPGISVAPGDLSMLIYTAGTTGPSKGCMVSHNYACNLAAQTTQIMLRRERETHWTCLPLFHLNAFVVGVIGTAMMKGRLALMRRFSVSNFWKDIHRSQARTVNLLGSMVPLLAAAPDNDDMLKAHGQLRTISCSPFPAALRQVFAERFGVKICGSGAYGLTEASLPVSACLDESTPPGASGRRNDIFDVKIIDDDGIEVPADVAGEIIVRPRRPNVMMKGYWNRPADTLRLMDDLWFHTGDIGKFDVDGFFYFVDRKKDYMRRRGENISSFEMETAFRAHPAIQDVAVHAVLSEVTEDDVKVTATLKEGASLTEAGLFAWAQARIPYFALPRFIEFREEAAIPRNPVGRILKYRLREEGCTPATWDREDAKIVIEKR